jgi:hypothetical protein
MALEEALARVPGLGGYLARQQFDQQQQLGQVAQAAHTVGLAGALQQLQQEQQLRSGLAGLQDVPPEQRQQRLVDLAVRAAPAKDILAREQSSLDRQAAIAATREATAGRLEQAKQNAEMLHEFRMSNITNARDRAAEVARHNTALEGIGQKRADQQIELFRAKRDEPLINFLDKIDATERIIQKNPEAVGGRGMLGRGAEFIQGTLSPGAPTPASDLQTQILDLQKAYRALPGHAASRLKIDAAKIDSAIKGLGIFTTADQALGSLKTLRESISRQLGSGAGQLGQPAVSPPDAPAPGQRQKDTVYQTPRGPMKWSGTGWLPAE